MQNNMSVDHGHFCGPFHPLPLPWTPHSREISSSPPLAIHFSPRGTEFARVRAEPTAPSFRHTLDAQVSRISCPNRPESTFRVYIGVFSRVHPFRCKHTTVSIPLDPRAAFCGEWVDGAWSMSWLVCPCTMWGEVRWKGKWEIDWEPALLKLSISTLNSEELEKSRPDPGLSHCHKGIFAKAAG